MIEQSVSLASNGVVKVPGYEQLVRFGYTKNRGVYRLHVDATGEWEGLTIRCFWHTPDGKGPPSSLVVGGSVAVPASVTAQPGTGCITFEGSDGTRTVTSADLRYRVSANSGTEDGTEPEPGTPAWQQLVDAVHTDATAAEQAKTDAQTAAQQAGQALSGTITAKEDALKAIGDKQTTATQAVDTARDKALEQVEASTEAALTAASEAAISAGSADQSAQEAAGSLKELKDGIASGDFKGEPGASPTVAVQDIAGGHRIVITDATGTSSVDVMDGKDATVDATLSQSGKAADAKVTGDELATKAVIDDTTVGTDAWSSKHIVDMLCPPLDETGNPVVCYPVAGYPLGVKVSWEPTQEGSGEPYPAGGGPNLLDISQCTATVGKPYGVTITIDGDVFKVSGVPSSEVTEEGQYSFAVASCTQTELRGKGYKITPFALNGVVSSAWGLRTEDEDSLAIAAKLTPGVNTDIQLRLMVSKDTPTAYAPYENIRPISGRTEISVDRCGENLLDISTAVQAIGATVDGDKIHITDTSGWGESYIIFESKFPPGTYMISFATSIASRGGVLVRTYNVDGEIVDGEVTVADNYVARKNKYYNAYWVKRYNPPASQNIRLAVSQSAYFRIGFCGSLLEGENELDIINPMFTPGTTAPTAYTPYTGQTTTLTLPHTIYGGTVDAVTGKGQETWKLLTLDGTEKWETWGVNKNNAAVTGFYCYGINDYDPSDRNILCSALSNASNDSWGGRNEGIGLAYALNPGSRYMIYSVKTAMLSDTSDDKSAVASFKSYLASKYAAGTPVQIAYKLEKPVPFTATGAQPISALSGINTVLTNSDSVTVTGKADPIKRITDLEDAVASMT